MNKKISGDIFKRILIFIIAVFLSLPFLFFPLLILTDDSPEILENLQNDKIGIYMDYKYKDFGIYKIGQIQIPMIGLEASDPYDAICIKENHKCYAVNGIIIEGQDVYIYHGVGYNRNRDNIFGIFTQNGKNFYSLNDLDSLPQEQKDILLDLQSRPRFEFE